jgi:hypothetical protein
MTTGEHAYLYVGQLIDEGPRTAVYPYAQLREMMAPEECRNAVLDETSTLESEFGLDLVQPLYQLLWTLNSSAGVFTSHTVAAPREHKPPLDWAREYVAVAVICLA